MFVILTIISLSLLKEYNFKSSFTEPIISLIIKIYHYIILNKFVYLSI